MFYRAQLFEGLIILTRFKGIIKAFTGMCVITLITQIRGCVLVPRTQSDFDVHGKALSLESLPNFAMPAKM